jgi:L-asparaginase
VDIPSDEGAWPWVEVVNSGAASSGRVIEALVAAGVQGIVVASTGNGSVHRQLLAALERVCSASRLPRAAVRVASRCTRGAVEGLPDHGWTTLPQLTPAQARIALMMALLQSSDSTA